MQAVHVSMVTNNMRFKANFGKIADFPDVILAVSYESIKSYDDVWWKCNLLAVIWYQDTSDSSFISPCLNHFSHGTFLKIMVPRESVTWTIAPLKAYIAHSMRNPNFTRWRKTARSQLTSIRHKVIDNSAIERGPGKNPKPAIYSTGRGLTSLVCNAQSLFLCLT